MKKIVLIALAAALGFVVSAQAEELPTINISLPINIIQPDPGLKELIAFSGAFTGTWPGHTPFVLIVEKINNQSVTVVYAVAPNIRFKSSGITERHEAHIVTQDKKPRLEFTTMSGSRLMFILGNGCLEAIYFGRKSSMRTTAVREDNMAKLLR